MDYKVIRSKRKKLTLTVERDCTVLVKAPYRTPKSVIDRFVAANAGWIDHQKQKHHENASQGTPPTQRQIVRMKKQAAVIMPRKTDYYARLMGVKYTGVKITSARKRWGSCKKDGSICYSYRNMLLSERCQDYVVVHELAHIKQFNHSPAFYAEIEKILPDYKDREKELKSFSCYDLY
ncbi:MAG: M48 family metallopeptidase [Oscillospiraceae bacterium]|nr:M48 family metallopeptidase [Oscillospiraceae bacterium]